MGDPQAALCSGASLVDTCSVVVAWMRWPAIAERRMLLGC
jgi:hypothetical protein